MHSLLTSVCAQLAKRSKDINGRAARDVFSAEGDMRFSFLDKSDLKLSHLAQGSPSVVIGRYSEFRQR